MDSPWRNGGYSPSSACEVAPYEPLDAERLAAETADLTAFTRAIAASPYDPEPWLSRAHCLRLLGFPELSLGDAYKSRLLVEAALKGGGDDESDVLALGKKAWVAFEGKMQVLDPAWAALSNQPTIWKGRVKTVLKEMELQIWTEIMEGLMAANACADYLAQSREAVARFPGDAVFPSEVANAKSWLGQREEILRGQVEEGEMGEEGMRSTMENGGVYPTAYPWMEASLVGRGEGVFELLGREFALSSTNCTVSKSTVRDVSIDGERSVEFDVFGVMATKDIEVGVTVLSDATVAGVTSSNERCSSCCGSLIGAFTNACCTTRYCSTVCSQTSNAFHPALCGKDLSFLYDAAESAESTASFSLDSLLLLRVLTMSIQENASQPLKTSLLDRLTPTYEMDHLIIFNFYAHIITPILTLQALSIDVFSNPLYDTWVLHTIRCRLQNNKHGQTLDGLLGTAVNPLYSMFNHSCDPNVEWEHLEENSTLRCFAKKGVREGEELFISYIGYGEVEYEERQRRLAPWIGRECGCKKCERERVDRDK